MILLNPVFTPEKLLEFFYKYGFVVIRNAISGEQADKSIENLWKSKYFLESRFILADEI